MYIYPTAFGPSATVPGIAGLGSSQANKPSCQEANQPTTQQGNKATREEANKPTSQQIRRRQKANSCSLCNIHQCADVYAAMTT